MQATLPPPEPSLNIFALNQLCNHLAPFYEDWFNRIVSMWGWLPRSPICESLALKDPTPTPLLNLFSIPRRKWLQFSLPLKASCRRVIANIFIYNLITGKLIKMLQFASKCATRISWLSDKILQFAKPWLSHELSYKHEPAIITIGKIISNQNVCLEIPEHNFLSAQLYLNVIRSLVNYLQTSNFT